MPNCCRIYNANTEYRLRQILRPFRYDKKTRKKQQKRKQILKLEKLNMSVVTGLAGCCCCASCFTGPPIGTHTHDGKCAADETPTIVKRARIMRVHFVLALNQFIDCASNAGAYVCCNNITNL